MLEDVSAIHLEQRGVFNHPRYFSIASGILKLFEEVPSVILQSFCITGSPSLKPAVVAIGHYPDIFDVIW